MICNIQENFAHIEIPAVLFNYRLLMTIISHDYPIVVDIRKDDGYIVIETIENDSPKIIRDIFAKYHDIDANFINSDTSNFSNSNEPLVSCIILLNMNDTFVRDLTIPSIIFNSKNTPIEIIVVNNGTSNINLGDNIKVIKSESYHIPKAYNNAASIAKGRYVAFFHDDCFLSDENWIDKCIYNLTDEVMAVGPEYHEFMDAEDYILRLRTDKSKEYSDHSGGFLKEVPLVMEKNAFFEIGGFPEDELFGQEDIFLHKKILSLGKRNLQVDVKNYHFKGISTFLLFSNKNDLVKNLCTHLIFSQKITKKLVANGFSKILTYKRNYCVKLIKHDMVDDNISDFCEKLISFSDAEGSRLEKFLNGFTQTFIKIKDDRFLETLSSFADFYEILLNSLFSEDPNEDNS